MPNCPKCHSDLKSVSNFCVQCGKQNETTPLDSPEEMTAELGARPLGSKDLTPKALPTNVERMADASDGAKVSDAPPSPQAAVAAPPVGERPRRLRRAAWLAAGVSALAVALGAVYAGGRQSANAVCAEKDAVITTLNSAVGHLTDNNVRLVAAVERATANSQKAADAIEKASASIDRTTARNEKLIARNHKLASDVERVSAEKEQLAGELAVVKRTNANRDLARNGNKGRPWTGRTVNGRKKSDGGGRPAGRGTYTARNGGGGTVGRYPARH